MGIYLKAYWEHPMYTIASLEGHWPSSLEKHMEYWNME